MGRENPQVVVLCEDKRHWTVIYHMLKAHGVDTRRIRRKISPAGRGLAINTYVSILRRRSRPIEPRAPT